MSAVDDDLPGSQATNAAWKSVIRAALKAQGISITELGRMVGTGRSTISRRSVKEIDE